MNQGGLITQGSYNRDSVVEYCFVASMAPPPLSWSFECCSSLRLVRSDSLKVIKKKRL